VIEVHKEFKDIFNKLTLGYTSFDLIEFVSIQSIYAKTIYRMLKQFRTQGWWQVSIEDFKRLLSVPETYKSSDIDKRILKPTLEQLGGSDENAIFKNLKLEKIKKKGRGRGGVLTGYKFEWETEERKQFTPKPTKSKVKKETIPAHITDPASKVETDLSEEESEMLNARIKETQQKVRAKK
jgi:plasmid replication initiation protein